MMELLRLGVSSRYDGKGQSMIAEIVSQPVIAFVALGAKMDALPGKEMTNVPDASTAPERMYARGHGAHLAMVLGAAALLT